MVISQSILSLDSQDTELSERNLGRGLLMDAMQSKKRVKRKVGNASPQEGVHVGTFDEAFEPR